MLNAHSPACDSGYKLIVHDISIVGRTIPSYRIASEMETWKWRPFRKLLDKQDRKIFDEIFSYSRLYNAAGTMACRPILIHVILMSIIFEHYKQLTKIESKKLVTNHKFVN
jgi:hypothetical protein